MLSFYNTIKKIGSLRTKGLPKFPSKKFFGNTESAFLDHRKTSLQNFFNTVFTINEVCRSKTVM